MNYDFDCVIVGGGVIGLACAQFFSKKALKYVYWNVKEILEHKQAPEIAK